MSIILKGRIVCEIALFASACMALVAVCSCGSITKDTAAAKQAVVEFHSQLDDGQYAAVYNSADPKFHAATTQADFTKILDAVHRKLGSVREAKLQNWQADWYAGRGTTVTLNYATTFSGGSGTEQFVWHIDNGRALLYGYHINSADLIEK